MRKFLSKTKLYILAFPIVVSFLGAASNQAVIWANHDRFPVRLNAYKEAVYLVGLDSADLPPIVKLAILSDGLIDPVHCVMTDKTHLNFLADWIDLKDAIYSPGDLLLMLGDYTWNYAPLLWVFVMCADVLRRKEA